MKKIAILLVLTCFISAIPINAFADEPSSWAEESINDLVDTQLFDGTRFNHFQKSITREEFVYFAVRLFEVLTQETVEINQELSFTDTDDEWALKAYSIGLTSGVGNNRFGPQEELTREQLATFFVRIMTMTKMVMNEVSENTFSDDPEISSWAKEAIYLARANDIIQGIGENRVAPQDLAQGEIAMILTHRILMNSIGKEIIYNNKRVTVSIEKHPFLESVNNEGVSVIASEKATLTNVFMNENEMEINVIEYRGSYTLPIIDFLEQIDPDQNKFQYGGNRSKVTLTVDGFDYSFYRLRSYYYSGKDMVSYSGGKQDGITVPSSFKAYVEDGDIYIPFNVLMSILEIPFTYDNSILSFEFGDAPVEVPDTTTSELDERGRRELNVEEDDVSTSAGLEAFTEKYHLGGQITSCLIPTIYDLNPDMFHGFSNPLWGKDELDAWRYNPPELIGIDGSTAPYSATSDIFYQWLSNNDPYMNYDKRESFGRINGSEPTDEDVKGGAYIHGCIELYTNKIDDLYIQDGAKNIYYKYQIDVKIIVRKWDPMNTTYTKMLLNHYYGQKLGDEVYDFVNMAMIKGGAEYDTGYLFGDREIFFTDVDNGISIQIGEPGFETEKYYDDTSDHSYVPGTHYLDPFSSDYIPY